MCKVWVHGVVYVVFINPCAKALTWPSLPNKSDSKSAHYLHLMIKLLMIKLFPISDAFVQ